MQSILRRALYHYGWDIRCRNIVPAHILRPALAGLPHRQAPDRGAPVVLDVGCGRLGIAGFLKGVAVIGTDITPPETSVPGFAFRRGSIMNLPFSDQSFPIVTCIDVLEHLSLTDRERAVGELVRVAANTLLVACPHGDTARSCDQEFHETLVRQGQPVPEWVFEHQRQPYPDQEVVSAQIHDAAAHSGRAAEIAAAYSEPAPICRFLRSAAARSGVLYALTNLLLGAMLPLFPTPTRGDSYRMILRVHLARG